MEVISGYMQLSAGGLLYALLLTLFIALSGYFFYRVHQLKQEKRALQLTLEEANLDRSSFIANNALAEDDSENEENAFSIEKGTDRSLLQQELEDYLLREQDITKEERRHFVDLSTEFVDFLKVRSGKIELNEAAFVFSDMLDDLAKSLRSQLSRMQVELIFHIDTRVPAKLYGDKRTVRLLLFHL
ncbi:MAG: hypothetical protein MUP09_11120, partial [Thiovulaceae bacterium]|nr:hypothetical protein [Sulfurimonadaceae bacterium]